MLYDGHVPQIIDECRCCMIGMFHKLLMNVGVIYGHVPQTIDACRCYVKGMFHKLLMNVGVT